MQKTQTSVVKGASWLLVLAIVFIGCGKVNTDIIKRPKSSLSIEAMLATSEYTQSATVGAEISLDSIRKYIQEYPELVKLTNGSSDYTLLAPSNKAFEKLFNAVSELKTITSLNILTTELIKDIIAYHFVIDNKNKSSLLLEKEVSTTLKKKSDQTLSEMIGITNEGMLTSGLPHEVSVTRYDIHTTNGTIHVIDNLLLSPDIAQQLLDEITKIIFIRSLRKYSILSELISIADADVEELSNPHTFKITTWLAMSISSANVPTENKGGITFFALTNRYINTIASGREEFLNKYLNPKIARGFILNHMGVGNFVPDNASGGIMLVNGLSFKTLSENTITVVDDKISPSEGLSPIKLNTAKNEYVHLTLEKNRKFDNGYIQPVGGQGLIP